MSATPVTLIGSFQFDNGAVQNGTFTGVAALTGLGVGGGPIFPPSGGNGQPPHIDHTLPGDLPHPSHPIVIPPPPDEPPVGDPPEDKPPPEAGGWGYWADDVQSWVYKPTAGQASPKR